MTGLSSELASISLRERMAQYSDFRLPKCAAREQSVKDHFSEVPSEILVHIISFLTVKEACRTSILSKRWIGLWTFVSQLDFDAPEMFAKSFECGGMGQQYGLWVSKVLESHNALVINKFRICFGLDQHFQRSIDNWLRFAFAKRVERVELDLLLSGNPLFACPKPCHFPRELLHHSSEKTSEKSPPIDYDNSCHPLPSNGFKYLRSLNLAGVNVTGEDFDLFLHNFTFLECLIVRGSGSQDMVGVTICGSSLALKHLEITHCRYLQSIIVRYSNLVSLNITWVSNLVLENVPSLVDVRVVGWLVKEITPVLSSCLLRLKVLGLHLSEIDVFEGRRRRLLKAFQLTALKQLILTVNAWRCESLIHLVNMTRSSPNLEKFVLKLHWTNTLYRRRRELKKIFKLLHLEHLKVVEIHGYYGRVTEDEIIMCFLKCAAALERIIVIPRSTLEPRHPRRSHHQLEPRAKAFAERNLKEIVPSSVELVVL